MSTSQQEALDFLESLKIENDKPKTSSQPVSLPTQFKPMPRPTHSIHSNPATTPTTSLTTPTTTPTPVGMPFKPMQRPPTTSLGTFRPVGPPPVVNSSQTKTKQKRVFQEFNPGNVPNATTTIQSAGQQNTIKPSGNVFDNPADQGLDTYQPVQYENVSLQQPSLNSQYQQPNQQKHQHHQDQKVGTFQGNGNEWWGSLFTTAQKGLQTARETAKGLAEEGARVVKESNVVKDFGEKGLLGLVAPPPPDSNLPFSKLWFCPSYDLSISEPLIRITKQAVSETWRDIFSTTTVNFVDDSDFEIVLDLQAAIKLSESKLEKLQKLGKGDVTSRKPIDIYLTIQPFYTTYTSSLFGDTRAIQFWCVLLAEMDLGLIHASGISQSVPERDEGFAKEMAGKVVQTVICDLVDEFKRFCKEPLI